LQADGRLREKSNKKNNKWLLIAMHLSIIYKIMKLKNN
jgi:hypothetical protein